MTELQENVTKVKSGITPLTTTDIRPTNSGEVTAMQSIPIIKPTDEATEVLAELTEFLAALPEASELYQKLLKGAKGNQIVKTGVVDALMTMWAYSRVDSHTYTLLEEILAELRELNGKPADKKDNKKVGRPRKE